MKRTPYFPEPTKGKVSLLFTFFKKKRSWLDGIYEKSYSMKMGRIKMPGLDMNIVNQTELVKRVMVDEVRAFPKHEQLGDFLKPLLGESSFTTNGEQWQKQRNMLNPSFENARISKVFELMKSSSDDLMEHLRKNKDGDVVEVDSEMTYVTADIIFRTIMSKKLNRDDAQSIILAFTTFQEETAKVGTRKMFGLPPWVSYFFGEKRRLDAGKEIRELLMNIIKPRYDAVTNNVVGEEKDILSTMLQEIDPDTNERFPIEQILDQIALIFLAGHETSASALTSALYLLSTFEEEQELAYKEVVTTFNTGELNALKVKKMKYLNNVFKETLRLYPPIGFFARATAGDITMRDKNIKKGASIVVSPWLTQRNKNYWNNPHDFNPDRFNEEINKDAYFPFGMGERVCIGASFATQEAILILASILKEYKLKLEPGFVPDIVGRLTIRSLNGMNIIFTKRRESI